ncbi:hypothetical protein MHU86_22314 [Fragilaria crotonensis]|nr:hypothetical protein MHU86_22314 [Fragilaria crotonensis]
MWTSTLEIIQLAMAHFNAVDWSQVMAILRAHVMVVRPHVSQFLRLTRRRSLLHCFGPYWPWSYCPKPSSTSPEPDPKELPSRRHRRALKQHNRKVTRRANVPAGSIRSHGLHRRYPINLRSMGRYIRRNAPTLVEQQQQVQLNDLHSKATLLQRVDSPSAPFRDQLTGPAATATIQSSMGQLNLAPSSVTHPARHRICRRKRKGQGSTTAMSTTPTSTLRFASSDAALAGFPSPTASIALSLPLASRPREPSVDLQATSSCSQDGNASFNVSVIWDSGASISITPDRKDFVGPINTPGPITQLQGIAKGLRIEGQGHVLWAMQDTLGNLRMLKVPAYLVSCIKVRLLSTTSLLQAYPGETITIEAHQLTLSGTSDEARGQLIARVNPDNNLPTSDAHRSSDTPKAVAALNITLNTVHESNLNLTEAEKELLRWHHRLDTFLSQDPIHHANWSPESE